MRSLALLVCLLMLVGCGRKENAAPAAPDLQIANAAQPGEAMPLQGVPGKMTLFEFYSEQCPPCLEMARALDRLAALRPDLAIRRLNIDRRSHSGIDFQSPLAQQYHVESVPCFRIFDASGKQTAEGDAARDQVRDWYSQAQSFHQGESDPGTRQIMKDYEQH